MESTQQRNGVLHWLNENFECIFMVSGLLMIIFFITWQVVYRYIITQFIERAGAAVWTEELSRYIFIWISYLAVSVAIRKRSSIRVDILYDHLPKRWQNISWIIVESLFFCLTAAIAWYGWGQIERLLTFPQYTTALRIPHSLFYLAIRFWPDVPAPDPESHKAGQDMRPCRFSCRLCLRCAYHFAMLYF